MWLILYIYSSRVDKNSKGNRSIEAELLWCCCVEFLLWIADDCFPALLCAGWNENELNSYLLFFGASFRHVLHASFAEMRFTQLLSQCVLCLRDLFASVFAVAALADGQSKVNRWRNAENGLLVHDTHSSAFQIHKFTFWPHGIEWKYGEKFGLLLETECGRKQSGILFRQHAFQSNNKRAGRCACARAMCINISS